jgi:uncharacterized protein
MTEELPVPEEVVPAIAARGEKYSPIPFVLTALVLIFVLYQGVGGVATFLLFGTRITRETVFGIRAATMLAQFVFLLAPALWLMKLQHGSLAAAIPMRIPKVAETILVILCVVSLQQVLEGYLYFQDQIPLPPAVRDIVETVKRAIEETVNLIGESRTIPELLFVMLVVAITPAICEELFFRGLVQKNLSLAMNSRRGVVWTGIIFALYHLNPFLFVPLAALGILFSYVRYRSNTLIIPIIAHFINNGISAVGFYWQQQQHASGSFLLEGGEADVAPGYVLGVMAVGAVICAVSFASYRTVTASLDTQQPEPTT